MQNQPVRRRTAAITILAVVAGIAGLWAALDVLRYLNILPIAQLGPLNLYTVNWLGAIFAGILALIWFMVARELWTLDPRGWLFVVIIAVFNLILYGLSWLGASSFNAVLPGLVINGVALILGLLPSTKAAFDIPPAGAR